MEKLHPNYSNERETQFNFTVVSPQAAKIVMDRKERAKAENPPKSQEEISPQPVTSSQEAEDVTSEEMPGIHDNFINENIPEQPDFFKEKIQKI